MRSGRLNIDDDAGVDVDQIIGRVSEERWTSRSCSPACPRVGQRDVLRYRANLPIFLQRLQILAYRARPQLWVAPIDPFLARNSAAAIGISLNNARIDRKAFATNQPCAFRPRRTADPVMPDSRSEAT
jgi:hypothetical protein